MKRRRTILGLALLLPLVLGVTWTQGAAPMHWPEIFAQFSEKGAREFLATPQGSLLFDVRLPRVLLAMVTGSVLAVAGVLMQGLFRNPLADPGLVGVSSGAALGAVLFIVLGESLARKFGAGVALYGLPLSAFAGSLFVCALIQRLAGTGHGSGLADLLLAGVAVNALTGAVMGFFIFVAKDDQLRSFTFWTLGSLGVADWRTLAALLPFCLLLVILSWRLGPRLNALALGEREAFHLGVDPARLKHVILLATALGVGACTAFTGMIAFVGLVVPHVLRLWFGPEHSRLLIGAALLGAILMLIADTAARVVVAPAELPLGLLTALLGAPFFLYLLYLERKRRVL